MFCKPDIQYPASMLFFILFYGQKENSALKKNNVTKMLTGEPIKIKFN